MIGTTKHTLLAKPLTIAIFKRLRTYTHQDIHVPVLLQETISSLNPKRGGVYVDGTFGAGGHSCSLLRTANKCKVYAIDRDKTSFQVAEKILTDFQNRLVPIHGNFGNMQTLLSAHGVSKVDGIMVDLGMSATQLDNSERGFSFRKTHTGPLDMRMDVNSGGFTAADVVNNLGVAELADIIETYGEDKAAFKLAKAIVKHRETKGPFTSTTQLAHVIRVAMPNPESFKKDPATRTFQALRIFVNSEFEEIDGVLAAAESLLNPGGRIAVITFHSLEDKRVMKFMDVACGSSISAGGQNNRPTFTNIAPNGIIPTETEIAQNPRSRSAKLRVFERT